MANISPAAHVSETAVIGDNVTIAPGCIIQDGVTIGDNCELRNNVLVCSGTTLGKGNRVFSGAVLGEEPQNVGEVNPDTKLQIGDNNVLREYITIHRGSPGGSGVTKIGDNNFIMAYTHIGHDCIICNNVVITNGCQLSGHVLVEDNVWMAGICAFHQFTSIGKYAYIAGGAHVSQDMPPFLKASGITRCGPKCVNTVGLLRAGFSKESVRAIKDVFGALYRRKGSMAIDKLVNEMLANDQLDENARYMLEFLAKSYSSPRNRYRELSRKH